jgi:hypothetical protein
MNKYFGALFLLGMMSCNNASHDEQKKTDDKEVSASKIKTVSFEDQKLQVIYDDYIGLKDALVASKYKEAGMASGNLESKLGTYAGCENTALIAKKIASASSIADQRKEFTFLSSDLIAMFKHADIKTGVVYVQHCPMANKGDGGDWLASEKAIKNPYYGSDMLECGGIVQEIKANK